MIGLSGLHFLQIYSYESKYTVERNGEWILLKSPMEIKRGELVRIDLFVSIPADRKNKNQKS